MAGAWFQHYFTRRDVPLAAPAVEATTTAAPEEIVGTSAEPLPDPEDLDFGAAFDRSGAARVVLLGEASHDT